MQEVETRAVPHTQIRAGAARATINVGVLVRHVDLLLSLAVAI